MPEDLESKIKELEETKAKLAESEEKFRTIFENTNDIIVYVDQIGKVIDISPNVEKLGYKREKLVGRNFTALGVFSLKEIPNLAKIFKDMVLKGQAMDRMSLNIKDKNGKIINVEVSTRAIRDNGQIKGAVNIIRDVTEHKKYEEELKSKIDALERYNKIAVGREHTMMELKERVKELEEKLAEKE